MIGAVTFAQQTIVGLLAFLIVLLATVVVELALNNGVQAFVNGPGQRWLRSIRRYPELARKRFNFFHTAKKNFSRLATLTLIASFSRRY